MDPVDSKIKFSIIVPTFNRCKLLQEAIQSILGQTYQHWELIVVDDGSTDGTAKYLETITDSRINVIHQSRGERSKARNVGVSLATGDYVLFLDDDDYVLPCHLMSFFSAIENNQKRSQIFRCGYYKEEYPDRKVTESLDQYKHGHPMCFAANYMVGVWSLCIPTHCLSDVRFPEEFPHWQDTHLILRLFARYPVSQLPGFTYVYRIHDGMGSRQKFDSEDLMDRATINVAAIEHFFTEYSPLAEAHLEPDTRDFLIAEKWLQYANRGLRLGHLGMAKYCRRQAKGFFFRLLKYRIIFWKTRLVNIFMSKRRIVF